MYQHLERALSHGGHPGGSYSSARILEQLTPHLRPTDLVLSSKGHDAAAFLAWEVERGTLPASMLDRYRQVNGYPGHPERGVTPGALVSTGSLGIGLSKAVGLAWADRSRRVICLVGDGECQEGQVWEAAQHAARLNLGNLIVLIDANGAQSDNRPTFGDPLAVFAAAGWIAEHGLNSLCFPPSKPRVVRCAGVKDHPHASSHRSPLVLAYADALLLAMNPRLVLLEADLAFDHGLEKFGTMACGIAEAHMVSMAVGLAAAGYEPICHTFARFYLRAADQITDALQEPGLAIRFVGGLAGPLPIGPGPSHELGTDLEAALFRCRTYTPRTPDEVHAAVVSMLKQPRSTYLRLLAQPELA